MKLYKVFLSLFLVGSFAGWAWADEPGYRPSTPKRSKQYRSQAVRYRAVVVRDIWGPYGRIDTVKLTCWEAQGVVTQQGATVLDTTVPNEPYYLFDRYVTDRAKCAGDETTRPVWVPTLDSAQCFLGYICAPQTYDGGQS